MMRKALGLIFLATFVSVLSAQNPSGGIQGKVTDPSRGAVANAQVTATNEDTNAATTVSAAGNGQFSFPALPAGTYIVAVTAPGLDGEADDIPVNEGEVTTLTIQLEAAEGDESAAGDERANPAPAQSPQSPQNASRPPSPPPNQTNANAAAGNESAQPGMIDLGVPPLSPDEMNAVMTWIAAQVSAINLPYCYRQSYGNGAGEPYTCANGYERNGLLCYPSCREGFAGNGPVCWGVCPPGSTDGGVFCSKPNPMPVSRDQNGVVECPQGSNRICGRGGCYCSGSCPAGWNDAGITCTKPSYGRGAGQPLEMGVCAPGLQKDPSGALCYPPCKADFHMVGPVCWQNCPSQQSFECGVGCATNQKECASGTINMVLAPIELAASLIPYAGEVGGAAHAVTDLGEAGAHAAEIGADASRIAGAMQKLKAPYQNVKNAMQAIRNGNLVEAVGGPEAMAKLAAQKAVPTGVGHVYVLGNDINKQIDLYSREYADNFDQLTSPAIAAQIDQRFGPVGAYQVKREWGVRHLLLALNSDGFASAVNTISELSTADLTGVLSVVSAYMKPVCGNNTPFPVVHPLYTN